MAILARTASRLDPVASALVRAGIPYRSTPSGTKGSFNAAISNALTDAVELSTIHKAKGLEWPSVAVVGLEEGTLPHASAATRAALEEERRLLYVAMTRAEDSLLLTWSGPRDPSRFLTSVEDALEEMKPRFDPALARRHITRLRETLSSLSA